MGNRGFSLLEVLVALAVAGLILTAMTVATNLVARREGVLQQIALEQENLMAAERLFRSVVSRAVPDVRTDHGEARSGGTSSVLDLVSLGPESLMFDRPQPLSLKTDSIDGAKRLMLRWIDPVSGVDREELVLTGARQVKLAYFLYRDGRPPGWEPDWHEPRTLPLAISLQLELPSLGPPIDIVVRTTAALPGACRAMPHEPYCQTEYGP